MTKDFKDLLAEAKPYLEDYLSDMGVKITEKGSGKFFSCINPEHEDTNPSASIFSNGEMFHCFSCGASGDIFRAASYLEDKPSTGARFVTENVEYILNKYGIEHSPIELTEEQLSNYKYESIYEEVYKLFKEQNPDTLEYIHNDLTNAEQRGWKERTCIDLGIGTIKDYNKFIEALHIRTRIPIQELKSCGIYESLFGPELLTFCIRDHKGSIRGFVARYVNWTKDSDTPKYRNTSIDDNPFYKKERILYMLNNAKRYNDMRLDIYEGYGSAVTAYQMGIRNACSIGGTALTEHHINLIRQLGFRHVNLVLDADATGTAKMDKYLDKFGGHSNLEVTITKLPFSDEDLREYGKNDPDYFLQKYGIEAYRNTKAISFFQHMLEKTDSFEEDNPLRIDFCNKMIPLLLNEGDLLRRSEMIKALAEHTSFDKEDIRAQIASIEKQDTGSVKEGILKDIRRAENAEDIQNILSNYQHKLQDTSSTKKDRYTVSLQETVDAFDKIFLNMNQAKEGIHGWKTGFEDFDDLLDGIPIPEVAGRLIGFAGAPQAGKSAAMLNILLKLLLNKDNKNLTTLFWAIDDNRKSIAYRLIPMISGVSIKKVLKQLPRTAEEDKAIIEAQEIIRQLIFERRLIIKDDSFSRSKAKAETWIKETQDQTSNHILFCVDSLHNVDGKDGQETRAKIMGTSSWLKGMTASCPATILTTIELVKNRPGDKPTLQNISETAKCEYDFDSIAVCWNEQQGKYQSSLDNISAKWGVPGAYKPVIELDFQKNKCGAGGKGSLYFKFDPDTTSFVDCCNYPFFQKQVFDSTINANNGTSYKFYRPKPEESENTEEIMEEENIQEW